MTDLNDLPTTTKIYGMNLANFFLAAVGDANEPRTWSGIPYHIIRSAQRSSFQVEGLAFDLNEARSVPRRLVWAMSRLLALRLPRGFQHSEHFLQAMWATIEEPVRGTAIVNCSQMYPSGLVDLGRHRLFFYLDQTLHQLYYYYRHADRVAADIRRRSIAEERRQYELSTAVIMQSQWAANDVTQRYRICPSKVHVVLPGANLDSDAVRVWERNQSFRIPADHLSRPFVLGFVGKEWARKGLDRLIKAVWILHSQHKNVQLRVIGCEKKRLPRELQDCPAVTWLGFVDKQKDPLRFIELMGEFDLGCLLSDREAGGISLLEFARLGIPTLAPQTGGAPELTTLGATTLISPEARPEQIAERILALMEQTGLIEAQRQAAWRHREYADWTRAINELAHLIDNSRCAPLAEQPAPSVVLC